MLQMQCKGGKIVWVKQMKRYLENIKTGHFGTLHDIALFSGLSDSEIFTFLQHSKPYYLAMSPGQSVSLEKQYLNMISVVVSGEILVTSTDKNGMATYIKTFVKGESGEHAPTLTEKWTTPPPYYNEASLLRAMETAGKFVEDETLRAAMKENGIGRPSSRASIIETLFKRHYIRRERKRLVATPTGIELIDLIREELLKSCELTGIWEKKLRDIELQKYDAQQFINELKQQVTDIVHDVMTDPTNRRITVMPPEEEKKKGKGKKNK